MVRGFVERARRLASIRSGKGKINLAESGPVRRLHFFRGNRISFNPYSLVEHYRGAELYWKVRKKRMYVDFENGNYESVNTQAGDIRDLMNEALKLAYDKGVDSVHFSNVDLGPSHFKSINFASHLEETVKSGGSIIRAKQMDLHESFNYDNPEREVIKHTYIFFMRDYKPTEVK